MKKLKNSPLIIDYNVIITNCLHIFFVLHTILHNTLISFNQTLPLGILCCQIGLERKNTYDNWASLVLYFLSYSCLVLHDIFTVPPGTPHSIYIVKDKNELTVEGFELHTLPKLTQFHMYISITKINKISAMTEI